MNLCISFKKQFVVFIFGMFVGIITENPHEISTRLLGQPRGLMVCCIC
ncbi:MAG: hypothetical protein K6253_02520 [Candidatus Liberibacter asiaticus]|nr:hypothetical protein [Candidatus Liberibacter asiaticus]